MNQRFRELMDQAGGEFYNGFLGSPNSIKFTEEDFEKFAELIVRECQLRVEQYISECREVASMPDSVIMKHFGIEE